MGIEADGNIMPQIVLIIFLTFLNAFFAASEMAIISLNKNKINHLADEGNKKAQLLIKLTEEPSKFLATIQVGITLAGFFSSASAAIGLSDDFAKFLSRFNLPYSKKISIVFITIVLSYITLVFGELFPKRIAMQKSEAIAMFAAKPLHFISKITVPFVKLLSTSTNLLVKISGIDRNHLDEKVSEEEIRLLVEVGQVHGVINQTEKLMINRIFEFDDKLAEEVMTPRTEVFLINISNPISEFLDELIDKKHSRIPVYEGHKDNIIGILLLKEFLPEAYEKGFENIDIRYILHTPYFVPETKYIDDLFQELQNLKIHMAILIDEYGGFSGIVTITDLIEEVMGDIDDEFDDNEPEIKKIDNSTYEVNGLLPINELNDYLNLDLDSEYSDTIGGFLINLLGNIPPSGKEIVLEYKNIVFKIVEVKKKRIHKIIISLDNHIDKEKK